MKIRLFVVAALAASSLGVMAGPASACDPEMGPCCPHDNAVDRLWYKLTGDYLIHCPWA